MFVVTCPTCGKKIVWDDFQPNDIRCTKCGERLNLYRELKKNIELREQQGQEKIFFCPQCKGAVGRRWFIQCPGCNYWLFGPFFFSGKWPFVLFLAIAYIIFSVIYLLYLR